MASVSLGAFSFLPPSSLHSGTSTQQQQGSHHQILQVNKGQNNSNITVSFSNHTVTQGIGQGFLEENEVGESKLEIIEEAQEEASPKETELTKNMDDDCTDLKNPQLSSNESIYDGGNRMRSCLMDGNMSSKEAVESLLLLGQGAVVSNDTQSGVCISYLITLKTIN